MIQKVYQINWLSSSQQTEAHVRIYYKLYGKLRTQSENFADTYGLKLGLIFSLLMLFGYLISKTKVQHQKCAKRVSLFSSIQSKNVYLEGNVFLSAAFTKSFIKVQRYEHRIIKILTSLVVTTKGSFKC